MKERRQTVVTEALGEGFHVLSSQPVLLWIQKRLQKRRHFVSLSLSVVSQRSSWLWLSNWGRIGQSLGGWWLQQSTFSNDPKKIQKRDGEMGFDVGLSSLGFIMGQTKTKAHFVWKNGLDTTSHIHILFNITRFCFFSYFCHFLNVKSLFCPWNLMGLLCSTLVLLLPTMSFLLFFPSAAKTAKWGCILIARASSAVDAASVAPSITQKPWQEVIVLDLIGIGVRSSSSSANEEDCFRSFYCDCKWVDCGSKRIRREFQEKVMGRRIIFVFFFFGQVVFLP